MGEPYRPFGQQVYLKNVGFANQGHLEVSKMRPIELTSDVVLSEVGRKEDLSGRFERGGDKAGATALTFVTERETFLVANDPPGVVLDRELEVVAWPVQVRQGPSKPSGQHRWVICGCSSEELDAWRRRRSPG